MNQPPFPPFPGAAPNPFGQPLPQAVPMPGAPVAFGQPAPQLAQPQHAPQAFGGAGAAFGGAQMVHPSSPWGQPQGPVSAAMQQAQYGAQPPQYAPQAQAPAFVAPALDLNNATGASERRPQIVHGACVDSNVERFHCFPSRNPATRGVVWLAIDLEVFASNHPAMPPGYKWTFMQDVNHPSAADTIKSALAAILGADPSKPVPFDLNAAYQKALGPDNPLLGSKVRATGYAKPVSGVNRKGQPKQPFPVPTFAPFRDGAALPALQTAQAAPAAVEPPADPPGTWRDTAGQYGPAGALYNTTTRERIS